MGSRAVVIVCRDEAAARRRFGVAGEGSRHLLHAHRPAVLRRAERWKRSSWTASRAAVDAPDFWDELRDRLVLPRLRADALVGQGAGAAAPAVRRRRRGGRASLCEAVLRLWQRAGRAAARRSALLANAYAARLAGGRSSIVAAYRRYCWPVDSIDDLKLAPFHLLATEGAVHVDQAITSGTWRRWRDLRAADAALLSATPYRVVDVTDPTREPKRHRAGGRS